MTVSLSPYTQKILAELRTEPPASVLDESGLIILATIVAKFNPNHIRINETTFHGTSTGSNYTLAWEKTFPSTNAEVNQIEIHFHTQNPYRIARALRGLVSLEAKQQVVADKRNYVSITIKEGRPYITTRSLFEKMRL